VLAWAVGHDGPVFIRLVRDTTQTLFEPGHRFQFGKVKVVREGSDITLISTGTQTPRVVDAADILATQGIDAHVVHVPTIKPLDVGGLVAAAEKTGRVVTVEEHTVIGGLGGAVAETLSEYRPTRVDRIGIQDHYTESATDEELLDMYCLSAERVAQRVQKLLVSSVPVTSCD
jgi:transketolase